MICALVLREGDVEAGLVAVERICVLHDELAQTQQASARSGLIALLDREVIEQLGQLPIARDLLRVERDGLLVRHRQYVLASCTILKSKELLNVIALRQLPELERREHRHEHLLPADRVHLLADDLDDLLMYTPAEREKCPHARGDLADVPATHEELVRDRLGVSRSFAQGRNEQL